MFRPTVEQLEQREVYSVSPVFAAIPDADSQVSMSLVMTDASDFYRASSSHEALQLLPHIEQDNLYQRSSGSVLGWDRGTMPVGDIVADLNRDSVLDLPQPPRGILIGLLLPAVTDPKAPSTGVDADAIKVAPKSGSPVLLQSPMVNPTALKVAPKSGSSVVVADWNQDAVWAVLSNNDNNPLDDNNHGTHVMGTYVDYDVPSSIWFRK